MKTGKGFHRLWAKPLFEFNKWLENDFSPAFFIPVMGIGISSNLLYNFPYPHEFLRILGYIFFSLGCLVLLVVVVSFVIVVYRHPAKLIDFHCNPKIAPFMGCFPMGYMTLVNFIWYMSKPNSHIVIFGLWCVSVVLSLYTSCIIFYFTFIVNLNRNKLIHSDLHLTILFPIVAITVASSQGNLFLQDLPSRNLQVSTLITCFCLWSIAICMAFIIITINFWKLFIHKLPPANLIFTSFLPVGFVGQAGYSVMLMGNNIYHIVKQYPSGEFDTKVMGTAAIVVTSLVCLLLISIGYFMTFLAIAAVLSKISPLNAAANPLLSSYGLIKFNRGFWAMTFPLGTMSLAQFELSSTFAPNLKFFKIMSTIYCLGCLICTVVCISGVLYRISQRLRLDD